MSAVRLKKRIRIFTIPITETTELLMPEYSDNYGLDLHSTMILEEYRENRPVFEKMLEIVRGALEKAVEENGLYVTAIETRIKTEASLAGKLELKGAKYAFLSDITDILGARVITFYSDEVDKISALVDRIFKVDWSNSVDKRKIVELDRFGYSSLHYICCIPESLYCDPACPEINTYRFEIQMRSALQHVWATINHDTGYKSGVEVPSEHLRNLNRLAGMLELVDEEFCRIRTDIDNYRREVCNLVEDGRFDDVRLDGDSFRSYLKLDPFGKLTRQIAAVNKAEIHESTPIPYLEILKQLRLETLGDLDRFIKDNSGEAYQLAVYQLGNTDLDIISSTVAIQNLCVVYILKQGAGVAGLKHLFDTLGGPSEANRQRAERIMDAASKLPFMQTI